jgi:hypothetical protein
LANYHQDSPIKATITNAVPYFLEQVIAHLIVHIEYKLMNEKGATSNQLYITSHESSRKI